jgi:hypothetical protein
VRELRDGEERHQVGVRVVEPEVAAEEVRAVVPDRAIPEQLFEVRDRPE